MNRGVFLIAFVLGLLAAGGLFYLRMTRPAPEPETVRVDATRPVTPAPARPPARTPGAPAAAPAVRAPREPSAAASAPATLPDTGTLHIDSDVPGAQVFIDRQLVGRSPITAPNIAPGSHQINVQAEGFEGIAETIDVAPGSQDLRFRLREVRLNASITVVHKHRIGSCTGQLKATARGLRYETTNQDDAFSAPLADLDTFEVAYLEKNLRVKPRGGKQYNFTDPEGNADRLFVFHRDVVKARDRLAKGDTPAD